MARARLDQIDELQFLLRKRFSHNDVGLKEHVLVTDGRDRGHDTGIRGIVDRIQHVQPSFLVLRQWADFDESRNRRLGKAMRIDISAIWP